MNDPNAVNKLIDDFMAALGNPPHIMSMVTSDEPQSGLISSCLVNTNISQSMKMPHAAIMLGTIFAQLADNDVAKLNVVLKIAYDSAMKVMVDRNSSGSTTSTSSPLLN